MTVDKKECGCTSSCGHTQLSHYCMKYSFTCRTVTVRYIRLSDWCSHMNHTRCYTLACPMGSKHL